MGARVMIVGGGARGHALAEAIGRSPSVERVSFAPGTSALEHLGYECLPVASQDLRGLAELALMEEHDLTVVGPNTPLVDGIVDVFAADQLPIFGPDKAAARLEGSKVFGRNLMHGLGIPAPRFGIADNPERALLMARSYRWARVFKADGIAYDKGVRVTSALSECEEAIQEVMVDNVYGLESKRVVVEQRIEGPEVTIFSLTDGRDVFVLGHVLNYPRLLDGDGGPPTRGMGQVSPSILDEDTIEGIRRGVLVPTIEEMAARETPLRGALFVDLMVVGADPYAIDYNVRFGDPATQTLLSAYSGDFYAVLQACRTGEGLADAIAALERDPRPRVSLVIVCQGYPRKFVRAAPIELDLTPFAEDPDVTLFYDGVRFTDAGPETTGGRAFTIVATADDVAAARDEAYAAARSISFEGMHFRSDIGV